MSRQRLDILFGFKAFSLAPDLRLTEKRVGAGILDHYNMRTGQCDPSLDTLATLLGIHRRTVIRSVNGLVRSGYYRRIRHGGKFHRNFYEPVWQRFREVEAKWKRRRYEHSQRFSQPKLSPCKEQVEHLAGDHAVTQTCPTNISTETFQCAPATEDPKRQRSLNDIQQTTEKERSSPVAHHSSQVFPVKHKKRFRDVAYDAAERRWQQALQDRFLRTPIYAGIIDAIDSTMQTAATEAEMKWSGAGLAYIINQLNALGLIVQRPEGV